jgi:hypothetical protein
VTVKKIAIFLHEMEKNLRVPKPYCKADREKRRMFRSYKNEMALLASPAVVEKKACTVILKQVDGMYEKIIFTITGKGFCLALCEAMAKREHGNAIRILRSYYE